MNFPYRSHFEDEVEWALAFVFDVPKSILAAISISHCSNSMA